MSESTIVAPATAPGRGGISVIRLSGFNSLFVAESLCGKLASPRKFKLCKIVKKSGEVESAISNIKVVPGSEDDGDELDLVEEKVSAKDAPFVKFLLQSQLCLLFHFSSFPVN